MNKALLAVLAIALSLALWLGGRRSDPPVNPTPDIRMARTGAVAARWLDEISGLQASRRHAGRFWVHNDDGPGRLGMVDTQGLDHGWVEIEDTLNRDWEDISLLPRPGADLLVIAETGDNYAQYPLVSLLFVEEPEPGADGRFAGRLPLHHRIRLRYPGERQDTEAMAFDPVGERFLLLSKRARPPRLYALDLSRALDSQEAELELLGPVASFRPPGPGDRAHFGGRSRWISQPTGMDISPDGRRAAVITYRSLYLFELPEDGDWLQGLQGEPIEIIGPPAEQEEAIGFSADGRELLVTSEGPSAPLFLFRLADDGESGVE